MSFATQERKKRKRNPFNSTAEKAKPHKPAPLGEVAGYETLGGVTPD